ncbi:Hypothetical protein SSCIU_02352 [Mammaliicoccus sciuri]|nr:Hypothetical protein SSCIU_02352 [Mammaliicoccus sciuri]
MRDVFRGAVFIKTGETR